MNIGLAADDNYEELFLHSLCPVNSFLELNRVTLFLDDNWRMSLSQVRVCRRDGGREGVSLIFRTASQKFFPYC
jgi:hypothetical protein